MAGLTISVGSGTSQEKILVEWDRQNRAEGLKAVNTSYFQRQSDYELALRSGRTDAHSARTRPSPTTSRSPGRRRSRAPYSGGGASIDGRIAVMTLKGNGLIEAVGEALNAVVKEGKCLEVLKRWGLESEALEESLVNPPGLPREM